MIYYLGYYADIENNVEQRTCSVAAVNKMRYISQAIGEVGEEIEIVSASGSRLNKKLPGTIRKLSNNVQLKLFSTRKNKNVFDRIIGRFLRYRALKLYLCQVLNENNTLLVYHAITLIPLLKKLRKKKKFRLILEVNELYSDVSNKKAERKKEDSIFKLADGFLFATEFLHKKINKENKPYLINNGTYEVEPILETPLDDGLIHCVYAGTFDEKKGGALAAIESGRFLDSGYHIHILGFGTEQEVDTIKSRIEEINQLGGCYLSYDGLLSGLEYVRFLQKCHIGLSTQDATKVFNSTSFPSKLLSYLSNGLKIVSARMPVIENSNIGDIVYYYESQAPNEIANAIQNASENNSYNARQRLRELDKQFKNNIIQLLYGKR